MGNGRVGHGDAVRNFLIASAVLAMAWPAHAMCWRGGPDEGICLQRERNHIMQQQSDQEYMTFFFQLQRQNAQAWREVQAMLANLNATRRMDGMGPCWITQELGVSCPEDR
jgi:hypothetical protein